MLGKGLGEHWCAMGCGSWLPGKACDLERGERRCGPGTEGSDVARLMPAWPVCLVRWNFQVGDGIEDSSCSLEGRATPHPSQEPLGVLVLGSISRGGGVRTWTVALGGEPGHHHQYLVSRE